MARKYGTPDHENPEWTANDFKSARPFNEVLADAKRLVRYRGPQKAPRKVAISIRLEPETLRRYRSTGKGWQARMGADLAKSAKRLVRRKRAATS